MLWKAWGYYDVIMIVFYGYTGKTLLNEDLVMLWVKSYQIDIYDFIHQELSKN